jgi:hypothetical protein
MKTLGQDGRRPGAHGGGSQTMLQSLVKQSHSIRATRKSLTVKVMLRAARPGFDSDRGRDFSRYHHMQTGSEIYQIGVDGEEGRCVKLTIHLPQ